MKNYKINIEYGNENIDNIFMKSLVRSLRKYIKDTCNISKKELISTHAYLSIKDKEVKNINDR